MELIVGRILSSSSLIAIVKDFGVVSIIGLDIASIQRRIEPVTNLFEMNTLWKALILLALCISIFNLATSLRREPVRRSVEAELAAREVQFVNRVKGKVNDVRVALGTPALIITNLEDLAEAYLGAAKSMTTEPPLTPK